MNRKANRVPVTDSESQPRVRTPQFRLGLGIPALLELASDCSLFIFMSGFPTGDSHPIYITPMLGTHKASLLTLDPQ